MDNGNNENTFKIMIYYDGSWMVEKKINHHGHYNHQKGCTWSQHRVQVELLGLGEASLGDFRGMSRFQQILN